MITEVIYSVIKDDFKNIDDSPVWKDCYREDEMCAEIYNLYPNENWYIYHIKFDNTKPIQLTKFKTIKITK